MSRVPHACQARQYGDQLMCAACGLNWDVNDPEPPACHPSDRRTRQAKATVKFEDAERPANTQGLPPDLPVDVAFEMVKTYQAHGGHLNGMRAAYRLLLDRMEP